MRCALLHLASCLVLCAAPCRAADDAPKEIKPETARNHVGEKCVVVFKVRHTKHGVNRKTYFLDSREDFRSEENFGVQIGEEMAALMKEKKSIGEPHRHFADKTIRVVGKIVLQEDRPYLRIENVEDIREVDEAK